MNLVNPMHKPKRERLFLCSAVLCFIAGTVQADAPSAPVEMDRALKRYAKPADWIGVGAQRRLNIRCSGRGEPTILLESGALADSMTWAGIQPALSELSRVCSYDRAGLGFSDGGPLPRDIDAAVTDLHALAASLKLKSPALLVGHSLGSNIVRRYAQLYPRQVSALVLLDPAPHQVAEFSAAWAEAERTSRASMIAFVSTCTLAAEQGELDAPAGDLVNCLRGPDPRYSERLNEAIRENKLRPAYWHTLGSTMQENGELFEQPVSTGVNLGDLPLFLLSAVDTYAKAPAADRQALERARDRTHEQIAAESTRSKRIRVEHAGHDVHIDQPQLVIDTIAQALEIARQDRERRAAESERRR